MTLSSQELAHLAVLSKTRELCTSARSRLLRKHQPLSAIRRAKLSLAPTVPLPQVASRTLPGSTCTARPVWLLEVTPARRTKEPLSQRLGVPQVWREAPWHLFLSSFYFAKHRLSFQGPEAPSFPAKHKGDIPLPDRVLLPQAEWGKESTELWNPDATPQPGARVEACVALTLSWARMFLGCIAPLCPTPSVGQETKRNWRPTSAIELCDLKK